MLLAFSAKSEELDILMLSLTFGNVEVKKYVALSLSHFQTSVFGFRLCRMCVEKVVLGLERGISYMVWMDGCCGGWMREEMVD